MGNLNFWSIDGVYSSENMGQKQCKNGLSLSCLTYVKIDYPSLMKKLTSFSNFAPVCLRFSNVVTSGGSKLQLTISSVIDMATPLFLTSISQTTTCNKMHCSVWGFPDITNHYYSVKKQCIWCGKESNLASSNPLRAFHTFLVRGWLADHYRAWNIPLRRSHETNFRPSLSIRALRSGYTGI